MAGGEAPSGLNPVADAAGPVAEIGQRLRWLEGLVDPHGRSRAALGDLAGPAWRRPTAGEPRWAAAMAMVAAIGLQVALPDRFHPVSRFLLPAVEAVILIVLMTLNPGRISRQSRSLRTLGLTLIGIASLANAFSAGSLVVGLVTGIRGDDPVPLLATGAAIYLTNIIVFALWYWELDRGGPAARAAGRVTNPDFLFPQMATPQLADPDWEPSFVDYLYVSFTNATAFSPTDTMPLTRWPKMIMLAQAGISLVTVALVIARAVNILQ